MLANGRKSLQTPDFNPVPVVMLFTPDAGASWLLHEKLRHVLCRSLLGLRASIAKLVNFFKIFTDQVIIFEIRIENLK
ncbi:hypothetical protein LMG29739_05774 [Paraburkholderia solisilvae]|uniref:Uncharacterized protein n=1 Tax=Paraburkholderia solisilvae TaxID=624376 RepID=A0A6J5EYE2_9BURK|nr:hypothetical protein LMG29739_05774 [Paraburkholderia solisilvae]